MSYRVANNAPDIEKLEDDKKLLTKFVKNNIKLSIALDSNVAADLLKLFVDSTLNQIKVTFTNYGKLRA